jgi:hypothetical protein
MSGDRIDERDELDEGDGGDLEPTDEAAEAVRGGDSAGRVQSHDLTVTKHSDTTTPTLMQ